MRAIEGLVRCHFFLLRLCEPRNPCINLILKVSNNFLHCRVARQCWNLFLNISGKVMPQTIKSLCVEWQSQRISRKLKQIWRTTPLCIFWTLRFERTKACFERHRDHISRIKNRCIHNLYYWCKCSSLVDLHQFLDFLDLLEDCRVCYCLFWDVFLCTFLYLFVSY